MTIGIRRAELRDAAVIVGFNLALAWESEKKELNAETLSRGVQAVLADSAKGFYLIAERQEEAIGQIMVTFEWSDWRNGWFWWIQSVFVDESHRRHGVFRSLYSEVLLMAEADEQVIGVRLYMDSENTKARSAYLALGLNETSYELLERYPL